jgi:C-3',4' desaturase CrtD
VQSNRPYDAVIVGAGVAGLTAAAKLATSGLRVLVSERHNVPGGCASFYQKATFRFDVGATLVGGFGPRGVHTLLFNEFGTALDAQSIEPSMVVHLPDDAIVRYGDARWPVERRRAFGPDAEPFWQAQEALSDRAWSFSSGFPALPVDLASCLATARAFGPAQIPLIGTLGKTVASLLPPGARDDRKLRAFLDAQLLITAQTDAAGADLAYGVTALDLAREGTYHLPDGVSSIANALARIVRRAGSDIVYGRATVAFDVHRNRLRGVRLSDGTRIACTRAIAAIPLQNLVALVPEVGAAYRARVATIPERWGAFMLYVGLPAGVVPEDLPVHHQLIAEYDRPLGEGNTTFLSFSSEGETRRARGGGRAVTISTHTDVARWERAARDGSYAALRASYSERLSRALERVVPGAFARAEFVEAATPLVFERYTGRARGLVGGMPQTPAFSNLRAFSHRTPVGGLYVCGDTTFPGQSTVGASLSGYAAARAILGVRALVPGLGYPSFSSTVARNLARSIT